MPQTIYKLQNIEHSYDATVALSLDRLSIDRASIVGLAGPNGSGKSTLLSILAQIIEPTQGLVKLTNGHDFGSMANRQRVSLLLQEPFLLRRSVFDNIAYGLRIRNDRDKLNDRVFEALNMVGLDAGEFASRQTWKLSGGEAQRVALATRLVLKPDVLLLDEPIANVDPASAELIKKAAVTARSKWGSALVIASHDLSWLFSVSDEVINLDRGRLIGRGVINIIPGPWTSAEDGVCRRNIGYSSLIKTTQPASQNLTAVIDPTDISVFNNQPKATPDSNILAGNINEMTLYGSSDQIMVRVTLPDLTLATLLKSKDAAGLALIPGREVWLKFSPKAISWK